MDLPCKQKSSGHAVTAHAAEGTSTSNPSLKVEHIRHVKSFLKHENAGPCHLLPRHSPPAAAQPLPDQPPHHNMPCHLHAIPPVCPSTCSARPQALTMRALRGFTQASRAETGAPDTPSASCSPSCSMVLCPCESHALLPAIVPRLWHSLVRHHAHHPHLQGLSLCSTGCMPPC